MSHDSQQSDSRITRRTALATSATTLLGTGALATLGSDSAAALEVGTFDVAGAERELGGAPTAVPVDADVIVEGETSTELQQIQVVLQAQHQRQTRELDETAVFDVAGEYSETLALSADLLDHEALTPSDLEAPAGETVEQSVRLGVVATAVSDNQIVAEDNAYKEVPLTVHGVTSVEIGVGAEVEVSIEGE